MIHVTAAISVDCLKQFKGLRKNLILPEEWLALR